MSYGKKEYQQKVLELGKNIFGNNFKPLIKNQPLDEFSKFLANIDIAVMNHDRQQGMTTMRALLFLEKKVYLSRSSNSFSDFTSLKLVVSYTLEIKKQSFEQFISNPKNNNKSILKTELSEKNHAQMWEKLFR